MITESPRSIQLFDLAVAINRMALKSEIATDDFRQIAESIDRIFLLYDDYCVELEDEDDAALADSGWGALRSWSSESNLLCWHVRTAAALNERVIRRQSSASIYHGYCNGVGPIANWADWTFSMFIPGLLLNLRDDEACDRLTDYMILSRAGYALRSSMVALANCPSSRWYPDRGDRYAIVRYVNSLIKSDRRLESIPKPQGLWRWVVGALAAFPEHEDLAGHLDASLKCR